MRSHETRDFEVISEQIVNGRKNIVPCPTRLSMGTRADAPVVIVGSSGSGKTTLARELASSTGWTMVPRYITRTPRSDDVETENIAISERDFEAGVDKAGRIIYPWDRYHAHGFRMRYGFCQESISSAVSRLIFSANNDFVRYAEPYLWDAGVHLVVTHACRGERLRRLGQRTTGLCDDEILHRIADASTDILGIPGIIKIDTEALAPKDAAFETMMQIAEQEFGSNEVE